MTHIVFGEFIHHESGRRAFVRQERPDIYRVELYAPELIAVVYASGGHQAYDVGSSYCDSATLKVDALLAVHPMNGSPLPRVNLDRVPDWALRPEERAKRQAASHVAQPRTWAVSMPSGEVAAPVDASDEDVSDEPQTETPQERRNRVKREARAAERERSAPSRKAPVTRVTTRRRR